MMYNECSYCGEEFTITFENDECVAKYCPWCGEKLPQELDLSEEWESDENDWNSVEEVWDEE